MRKKIKFIKRVWNKKIKLGKRLKKKRKWRAAKGRDNKIRLGERGYAQRPSIGWGGEKKNRGKIRGFCAKRIENLKELEKINKKEAIIVGKVGKKKRKEIIKKAKEMEIHILNKWPSSEKLSLHHMVYPSGAEKNLPKKRRGKEEEGEKVA